MTYRFWEAQRLGRVIARPRRSPQGACLRPLRRTVALPRLAVQHLREHRKRQNAQRLTPAEAWREHGLVFASTVGTPIEARNINRRWDELRRRLIGDISGTFELSELDAEDEDDQAPA